MFLHHKNFFQIRNENILVAAGYIEAAGKVSQLKNMTETIKNEKEMVYSTNDIYRIFQDRGYDYKYVSGITLNHHDHAILTIHTNTK